MDTSNNSLRILMFPWLAHGHISPFVELAKQLAERNFNVFLCSTSANLSSIKKKVGGKLSIRLVELQLPNLPNLPPHYHTTNGLPPHLMDTLKKAYDMARPRFSNILRSLKPDLVIYDFLRPWPAEAAAAQNIPAVQFIATSVTMTSFMIHAVKRPGIEFPFKTIHFHDYESNHESELRDSVENRVVIKSLEKSKKMVLVKGLKEMEGKYTNYLSLLSGKKIVHVGPLVSDPDPIVDGSDSKTIDWLNKKNKCSTIFVSFGSEYFLSKEDFNEIAHGLLLSNVNFIWVVRFPVGKNIRVEDELPEGFLEKVGDRGMVVRGWAPQAKILGHSSIGGFISHCGWNSVIESMSFGVPIIAMPMHLDQPVNARLLGEVGSGVEVLRDEDGRLERETIAAVIDQVVKEETGDAVRKKAKELSDNIKEKGDEDIDGVVKELVKVCSEKNFGYKWVQYLKFLL